MWTSTGDEHEVDIQFSGQSPTCTGAPPPGSRSQVSVHNVYLSIRWVAARAAGRWGGAISQAQTSVQ